MCFRIELFKSPGGQNAKYFEKNPVKWKNKIIKFRFKDFILVPSSTVSQNFKLQISKLKKLGRYWVLLVGGGWGNRKGRHVEIR